jgi:hypothetical protein
MKKLFDLAYEKFPEVPGGYFDGEMIDGNTNARWAYIQGFQDAVKYLKTNGIDKLNEFLGNE